MTLDTCNQPPPPCETYEREPGIWCQVCPDANGVICETCWDEAQNVIENTCGGNTP